MANPPATTETRAPAALKTSSLERSSHGRPEESVQSPSVSTPSARARFEFENGRGNEGSKVVMVEWEDDEETSRIAGAWTVSWEGKPPHILPAEERTDVRSPHDMDSAPSTVGSEFSLRPISHRLYFLIGPEKAVPATVTLTLTPSGYGAAPIVWKTNPLPAIFPQSEASPQTTKDKGVLHTIWAEKRLEKLEREIEEEAKLNCEGIGLQMALSEKEWIEYQFGMAEKSPTASFEVKPLESLQSPTSPLSPGGGRLSEKLRGLKLQTSHQQIRQTDDDIAVPLCKRKVEKLAAAAESTSAASSQPKIIPIFPRPLDTPQTASSLQSIGAMLSGKGILDQAVKEEGEKELFALPLSPRSPEMTKSPFTFAAEDITRYLGSQRVL